jgi:hypothetical protein
MPVMDFIPPPMPSVAIERKDEHTHQIHLEPAQPHLVLKVFPVSGYDYDISGSVQGGVIRSELDRIDWE